jgi:hypothetical protein
MRRNLAGENFVGFDDHFSVCVMRDVSAAICLEPLRVVEAYNKLVWASICDIYVSV